MGELGRGGSIGADGAVLAGASFIVLVVVVSRSGGRRMTPCMAGNVRVPFSTDPIFAIVGRISGVVGGLAGEGGSFAAATGTGLIAGG